VRTEKLKGESQSTAAILYSWSSGA
jgi:hypothetical protein